LTLIPLKWNRFGGWQPDACVGSAVE
jgi:hypothetical protein